MEVATPETVETVTVIADVGGALVCEAGGRRTVIPRALILAGSEVSKPGDHGNIVIPSRFAFDLGFPEHATSQEGMP
jgi:hypothetical protein